MKIALVTGGNSGIGYAAAAALRDRGYEVFICGRDKARVNNAARELSVKALIADVAKLEDLRAVAAVFKETGLDALVHAAGTGQFLPLGDYTPDSFSAHFDTNVRAPLFLTQYLLGALEKRRGAVTTVSSIVTRNGVSNCGLYAATKGAIDAFTRSLAVELAPRGIRVNAVAPGAIETPIFAKAGLNEEQQKALAQYHAQTTPLGRRGTPEEVAQVIVAQLESTYVTGSLWCVDGGV